MDIHQKCLLSSCEGIQQSESCSSTTTEATEMTSLNSSRCVIDRVGPCQCLVVYHTALYRLALATLTAEVCVHMRERCNNQVRECVKCVTAC